MRPKYRIRRRDTGYGIRNEPQIRDTDTGYGIQGADRDPNTGYRNRIQMQSATSAPHMPLVLGWVKSKIQMQNSAYRSCLKHTCIRDFDTNTEGKIYGSYLDLAMFAETIRGLPDKVW